MKFVETPISGLLIIEPQVFEDERGFSMETYHQEKFHAHGICESFVQQNHSRSKRGVLRGLHYQNAPFAQGKLVRVTRGEAFDVSVDLRPGSATFGKWFGAELSGNNYRIVYIPPGFAHGFCALTDDVDFLYSCTSIYSHTHECGIAWNDPDICVPWPIESPIVSLKDMNLPNLRSVPAYKEHLRLMKTSS